MTASPADDSVVLNYILLDPREKHDIAYPLEIPRILFERSAFHLRSLIASEIENEFGLRVDVKYLRLWKGKKAWNTGRRPFDPISLSSNLLDQLWLLAFTDSLADSLRDSLRDSTRIHLVVTVHPHWTGTFAPVPSVNPGPLENADGNLDIPPVVATGVWNVNHERPWDDIECGERHSTDVRMAKAASGFGLVLGASMIDFSTTDKTFKSLTYADNMGPASIRLHLDTWGGSRMYKSSVTWLRHSPHPLLQSGSVDAGHVACARESTVSQRIEFDSQYPAPPKVFVALSGIQCGDGDAWDLRTYATCVDSRGFALNIARTWQQEDLGNSQVHWFAFPEYGVPGLQICSGEFKVAAEHGKGSITFERAFKEEPMVFIALTEFRMGRSRFARLAAEVSRVTGNGMDWSLGQWHDTVFKSAACAFLAIENRNFAQ